MEGYGLTFKNITRRCEDFEIWASFIKKLVKGAGKRRSDKRVTDEDNERYET
jgi:hypothetical protein